MTQGEECKTREHEWYRELGFEDHLDRAKEVLSARERLRVYGKGYKCVYTFRRQSGSNDTSSGNSKITAEVIVGYLISRGVTPDQYALVVLGDDNYLMILAHVWHAKCSLQGLFEYAAKLGFKLKAAESANAYDIEFISCRFLDSNMGYCIGKKPGRVLAKLGWMMWKPHLSWGEWEALFKGNLISYKSTASHVPFLRVYVRHFLELLKDVNAKFDFDWEHRLTGTDFPQANTSTWVQFEETYGLTRNDEAVFEKELKKKGMHELMHCDFVDRLLFVDRLM